MHRKKGSESAETSSVGLVRWGPPHTVGVVYKAFIEKMGPEAKVLWTIQSSLMLVRGGACAWFILSSIKEKIKLSHWAFLKMN